MTLPITTVDCRGMRCPAPILALSKATKKANAGAVLEVLADDGDFPTDLEAWCRSTGAKLAKLEEDGGVYRAAIELKGGDARTRPPKQQASSPLALTKEVDCRGMRCPAPILTVAKLAKKQAGPVLLRILADDGDFPVDLKAWCDSTGHQLLELEESGAGHIATVGLHGAALGAGSGGLAVDLDLREMDPAHALLQIGQHSMSHGEFSFAIPHDRALEAQLRAWSAALTRCLDLERHRGHVVGQLGAQGSFENAVTVPVPVSTPEAEAEAPVASGVPTENKCTLLVLRNDFESLMAALMVANASAAQGMEVEVYFSFWGVNVLRGDAPRPVAPGTAIEKPGFLKSMMKWMMPAGPHRQQMSKMNFGGAGVGMMKYFMKQQNILGIGELMNQAIELDVKFVVCTMSMGIMGITKPDLMDLPNIEFGGVTAFSGSARVSASAMVF